MPKVYQKNNYSSIVLAFQFRNFWALALMRQTRFFIYSKFAFAALRET